MMHIAHVGDSRCVLGRWIDGKWNHVELTFDHKPDLPEERKRIEAAGGKVVFDGYFNYRVYAKNGQGGLNMSRAMGDLNSYNNAGLSCTPDTTSRSIETVESPPASPSGGPKPEDKKNGIHD